MTRFILQWPALTTLTIVLLGCLCLDATLAFGQATNTGTVVGVVTDNSGAVIPGATITLTDVTTSSARATTSNDTGQYVFVNVTPSNYSITVTKPGFSNSKITSQTVSVGTQTTANFKLQVGTAQQTVEVQVTGAEL
jgi:hypothetical protein